jgi:hypothetical protein
MKKIFNWQFAFALILIGLSAAVYGIHYLIFRDAYHMFYYLVSDIAFLFLNVLIVALILNRLLEYREKQLILKKLNMAIGTFFSEIGRELLTRFIVFDRQIAAIREKLADAKDWNDADFGRIRKEMMAHQSGILCSLGDLEKLKTCLLEKRHFLLSLLQNQNLLEHESFTDMLWAIFHLADELAHRRETRNLPETDSQHLSGDIKRAYQLIIVQWIDYLKHLKRDYPYLYSLAVRTNPFDIQAKVEITA